MNEEVAPTTPSGWYPDPWGAAPSRYWDGAAWTGYTSAPSEQPGVGRQAIPISRRSTETSAKFGRWGMIVFAANAVLTQLAFTLVLSGFATSDFSADAGSNAGPSAVGGVLIVLGFIASAPLQFAGIAYLALLITWTYRNAQNGVALGIPQRRTPGWAIGGWFIPVVSLWFPYQSICDALPAERRPRVLRWWLMFLIAPIATVPLILVTFGLLFLGSALLVFAAGFIGTVVVGGVQFLQVRWGFEVTDRIRDEQIAIAEAGGLLRD